MRLPLAEFVLKNENQLALWTEIGKEKVESALIKG